MKRLSMMILLVITIICCILSIVSCTPDDLPPINIETMEQLSIVMGNEYYYPSEDEHVNKIYLRMLPASMPRKLEYSELLTKVYINYDYVGAQSCELQISKKENGFVYIPAELNYNTSIIGEFEIHEYFSPYVDNVALMGVTCETIYKDMNYVYTVRFKNDSPEELEKCATQAIEWIRQEIGKFKIYNK